MKKKLIYFVVGFITIVIIINYVPFMRIFIGEYWHYSNFDGSYREEEMMRYGFDYKQVRYRYKKFLERNPEKKLDTNLYINDKKNYLKFWNYRDYGDHPRWDLPYRSTDSLKYNYNGYRK